MELRRHANIQSEEKHLSDEKTWTEPPDVSFVQVYRFTLSEMSIKCLKVPSYKHLHFTRTDTCASAKVFSIH